MSALKSIINKDQADKQWQQEDFDNHWTELHSANTTINYFLVAIAVLLTTILYIVVRGL